MAESHSTPIEAAPEPDLSGRRLGDYQLLRRLGRGGMAEVYLAEQQSLRRQVAFKVLKHQLSGDQSYVQRFHNEAQAAAALVQANIVQIHEVGCIDGIHFIAQEYVKGQNLNQLLSRNGPIAPAMAINIMRQVAAALHKAGEQGIIHRDIKPENIMITGSGEVKVADFGLARVVGDGKAVDLTQVGVAIGTPLYMSPEQVEGRSVDQRSDVYSFGVTCWQMLTGRPPFDGETPLSVAVQHLKNEPKRLEELRPDLPIGLCCLVHKMMAKEPDDRIQRAIDLLRELKSLPIDGVDDQWPSALNDWEPDEFSEPTDSRLAATQRLDTVMKTAAQKARNQRIPWTWIAVAAAAALLVGGFLAWLTNPPPLLRASPHNATVPRQETARDQYRYAFWAQTEEAWRSVEKNFPPNDNLSKNQQAENLLYSRLAKQRLAEFYLQNGNIESAMEIFNELANLEDSAVKFRAFGIAGQAIAHWHRGEKEKMAQKLNEVYPHLQDLQPDMRSTIQRLNRERQRGTSPTKRNDRR